MNVIGCFNPCVHTSERCVPHQLHHGNMNVVSCSVTLRDSGQITYGQGTWRSMRFHTCVSNQRQINSQAMRLSHTDVRAQQLSAGTNRHTNWATTVSSSAAREWPIYECGVDPARARLSTCNVLAQTADKRPTHKQVNPLARHACSSEPTCQQPTHAASV